jgi:hypothetical protein
MIRPMGEASSLVEPALERSYGLTAATLGSAPMDYLEIKMGFVVLVRLHELFSYPDSGLVTSVKKIKERPDEIKRVIEARINANRYIRTEREGTTQCSRPVPISASEIRQFVAQGRPCYRENR